MKDIVDSTGNMDTSLPRKPHRRNRFATSRPHRQPPCTSVGTDPVDCARARFSPCLSAIVCLLSLDSTLRLPKERLRLRLLVIRLVGPVQTADIGNELRNLQRLHARGFPVPAMDVERDFKAEPSTAFDAMTSFRRQAGTGLTDAAAEAAHVAQTVAFMEPFGTEVDLAMLAATATDGSGFEPWTGTSTTMASDR